MSMGGEQVRQRVAQDNNVWRGTTTCGVERQRGATTSDATDAAFEREQRCWVRARATLSQTRATLGADKPGQGTTTCGVARQRGATQSDATDAECGERTWCERMPPVKNLRTIQTQPPSDNSATNVDNMATDNTTASGAHNYSGVINTNHEVTTPADIRYTHTQTYATSKHTHTHTHTHTPHYTTPHAHTLLPALPTQRRCA